MSWLMGIADASVVGLRLREGRGGLMGWLMGGAGGEEAGEEELGKDFHGCEGKEVGRVWWGWRDKLGDGGWEDGEILLGKKQKLGKGE